MKGQNGAIIKYLKSGRSLTPLQALERFGCFRLAARIHEIQDAGYSITRTKKKLKSGKSVMSYSLEAA